MKSYFQLKNMCVRFPYTFFYFDTSQNNVLQIDVWRNASLSTVYLLRRSRRTRTDCMLRRMRARLLRLEKLSDQAINIGSGPEVTL